MSLQIKRTNRRQFLGRSALGASSLLFGPLLLESCTDHITPDPHTPVGSVGPSKGVEYYAYFGNTNFSLQIQKPTDLGKKTQTVQWPTQFYQMLADNFQIAESDIGITEHTGRFQWHLKYGDAEISSGYAEIAPSTGNLGNSTIGNMLNTHSTTMDDFSVSYGFYDSGPGVGSLTNQDQFYIYATQNQSNWMGRLANDEPFNRFVLAGAHDAGMFDPSNLPPMVNDSNFLSACAGWLKVGVSVLESMGDKLLLIDLLVNLSFTQKDSVVGMLNLGIRYFDFRPGYNMNDTQSTGNLYHQHNFIPGYSFKGFISDTCQWLHDNPSEIVVVALGNSGFYDHSYMNASPQTLWTIINQYSTANNIGIGSKPDLTTSYRDLIRANKRLIILGQYGFKTDSTDPSDPLYNIPIWDTVKYDSYTSAYETTNVNAILNALNGMNADGQKGYDYTVLQLQGTASGASGVGLNTFFTASNAHSPLMSTKAQFDHSTYPWIQANGPGFSPDQLLVCLNDFADNALAQYCGALTIQRL